MKFKCFSVITTVVIFKGLLLNFRSPSGLVALSREDKSHTHSIIVSGISLHILPVSVKAKALMSEIPQMDSHC